MFALAATAANLPSSPSSGTSSTQQQRQRQRQIGLQRQSSFGNDSRNGRSGNMNMNMNTRTSRSSNGQQRRRSNSAGSLAGLANRIRSRNLSANSIPIMTPPSSTNQQQQQQQQQRSRLNRKSSSVSDNIITKDRSSSSTLSSSSSFTYRKNGPSDTTTTAATTASTTLLRNPATGAWVKPILKQVGTENKTKTKTETTSNSISPSDTTHMDDVVVSVSGPGDLIIQKNNQNRRNNTAGVRFSKIEIREFVVQIGDSPYSEGPPICLSNERCSWISPQSSSSSSSSSLSSSSSHARRNKNIKTGSNNKLTLNESSSLSSSSSSELSSFRRGRGDTDDNVVVVDVKTFDDMRKHTRRGDSKNFRWGPEERARILLGLGYSTDEIKEAVMKTDKTRRELAFSLHNKRWDSFNFLTEKASRKFKKFVSSETF